MRPLPQLPCQRGSGHAPRGRLLPAAVLVLALLLGCCTGRGAGRDFPTWRGERPGGALANMDADAPNEYQFSVASRRYPVTAVLESPYPCGLRRFAIVRNFIEVKAQYFPTLAVRYVGLDPRIVFLEGRRVRGIETVAHVTEVSQIESILDSYGLIQVAPSPADASGAHPHYRGFVRDAGPGFWLLRPADWQRKAANGSTVLLLRDPQAPLRVLSVTSQELKPGIESLDDFGTLTSFGDSLMAAFRRPGGLADGMVAHLLDSWVKRSGARASAGEGGDGHADGGEGGNGEAPPVYNFYLRLRGRSGHEKPPRTLLVGALVARARLCVLTLALEGADGPGAGDEGGLEADGPAPGHGHGDDDEEHGGPVDGAELAHFASDVADSGRDSSARALLLVRAFHVLDSLTAEGWAGPAVPV